MRVASQAAMEFLSVVVGVVGDAGRGGWTGGVAKAEVSVTKISAVRCSEDMMHALIDGRRGLRGYTCGEYLHVILASDEAANIA